MITLEMVKQAIRKVQQYIVSPIFREYENDEDCAYAYLRGKDDAMNSMLRELSVIEDEQLDKTFDDKVNDCFESSIHHQEHHEVIVLNKEELAIIARHFFDLGKQYKEGNI